MRRVARHLFPRCSAVSLLLCVAVCVLWMRSFEVTDDIVYTRGEVGQIGLGSAKGRITLCIIQSRKPAGFRSKHDGFSYTDKTSWTIAHTFLPRVATPFQVAGFQVKRVTLPETQLDWVIAPLWSVVVLTAVPPAIQLGRWKRRRRYRKENRCLTCGYDLRASPERCPECGAAIVA